MLQRLTFEQTFTRKDNSNFVQYYAFSLGSDLVYNTMSLNRSLSFYAGIKAAKALALVRNTFLDGIFLFSDVLFYICGWNF